MHLLIKGKSQSNIYKKIFCAGNAPNGTVVYIRDRQTDGQTHLSGILIVVNIFSFILRLWLGGTLAVEKCSD